MRISLRNQYSSFLSNLHGTQSRLMELNQQSSSQKRINRPSDDPVGAARVLDYRASIGAIDQYRANIDTAKGWLGLADETMLQTSAVLTRIKSLAEQGATGTMTASDREATGYEVRQLFQQLINLANTRFEGDSIFGGHKFAPSAYEEGLMYYNEDGVNVDEDGKLIVTGGHGASNRSIAVQFLGTGTAEVGQDELTYRFSKDGGQSWTTKTMAAGDNVLDLDGVDITLRNGYKATLSPESNIKSSVGSWLTIAPTAFYQGDHEVQSAVTFSAENPPVSVVPIGAFQKDITVSVPAGIVFGDNTPFTATITSGGETWDVTVPNSSAPLIIETPYGGIRLLGDGSAAGVEFTIHAGQTIVQNLGSDVNARAQGVFEKNIMVRLDNDAGTIGSGTAVSYSYSLDEGRSWSSGHTSPNSTDPAELLVPGGKLILSKRGTSETLPENAQFVIHPQTAKHSVEISPGEYLQINNIGADVFGGHLGNGTFPLFSETDPGKNIFVSVGKLVAALENNDQQGCGQALEDLTKSHEHFTTRMASVGARENRLMVADTVLAGLKHNETERMSRIEDVDLVTLMTDLTNQQLAYEAVLRSSSMIMRMSLMDYL